MGMVGLELLLGEAGRVGSCWVGMVGWELLGGDSRIGIVAGWDGRVELLMGGMVGLGVVVGWGW